MIDNENQMKILQHMEIMWNSSFGVHMENFIGTLSRPVFHGLSVAAAAHRSRVELRQTLYDLPADPKIFTS